MSPLRKVNKIRIDTKTLSHKGTQSNEYESCTLSESLNLCAFVAGLDLSEWTHILYLNII